MTSRAEAKRIAHGQVAALIRVNMEAGEGDMYEGVDEAGIDVDDLADVNRLDLAFEEIANYHSRMSRQ